MGKPRTILQNLLEEKSGFDDQHVIFQPGPDATMTYPAIVYEVDDTWEAHADNKLYAWANRYQVTLMTRDPDEELIDKIREEIPLCAFDRRFAVAGLNHIVFVIYH